MSLTFVTGDEHFGDPDVIRRRGRPFASARAMDEELVRRWRRAVSPADTVYVLGDFARRCSRSYAQGILDRLYGRKILVAGGHDVWIGRRLRGWDSVLETAVLREAGRPAVVLYHEPPSRWPDMRRGSIMLHAHAHSKRMAFGDELRADCGADATGFWPIPLTCVYARARLWERERSRGA